MFEKILLPISSEFYPRNAMRRGVFLAEKFGSSIKILYIIEEKTLEKADRISDIYRTQYEKEETESNMEQEYLSVADRIVFEDAKKFFDGKGIQFDGKVIKGEFSDVIKDEIERERYDLILMGFEKGCLLHYRILENSDIPIWIESAAEGREVILAVCSNLAPNQKVPEISVELSRTLGWELRMLYVVDTQDRVEVDK
ncbi:MAG: universal stress protein, partial [Thermoplasmata archaeon]